MQRVVTASSLNKFSWFYLVPARNCWVTTSIRQRPFPYKSSPIHQSSYHPTPCSLNTESVVKQPTKKVEVNCVSAFCCINLSLIHTYSSGSNATLFFIYSSSLHVSAALRHHQATVYLAKTVTLYFPLNLKRRALRLNKYLL
jgi:hypothetical protein